MGTFIWLKLLKGSRRRAFPQKKRPPPGGAVSSSYGICSAPEHSGAARGHQPGLRSGPAQLKRLPSARLRLRHAPGRLQGPAVLARHRRELRHVLQRPGHRDLRHAPLVARAPGRRPLRGLDARGPGPRTRHDLLPLHQRPGPQAQEPLARDRLRGPRRARGRRLDADLDELLHAPLRRERAGVEEAAGVPRARRGAARCEQGLPHLRAPGHHPHDYLDLRRQGPARCGHQAIS
mmetsp:Transcript_60517/g.172016  ORF Transcript_60517/g.172016 Transcript_60517/m.172016 type:complete len:234 (+) Transcript_60517:1-702(+)